MFLSLFRIFEANFCLEWIIILPATFFQQKPSFFQFQGFVRIALNLTKLCTARNLYIYTVYI